MQAQSLECNFQTNNGREEGKLYFYKKIKSICSEWMFVETLLESKCLSKWYEFSQKWRKSKKLLFQKM